MPSTIRLGSRALLAGTLLLLLVGSPVMEAAQDGGPGEAPSPEVTATSTVAASPTTLPTSSGTPEAPATVVETTVPTPAASETPTDPQEVSPSPPGDPAPSATATASTIPTPTAPRTTPTAVAAGARSAASFAALACRVDKTRGYVSTKVAFSCTGGDRSKPLLVFVDGRRILELPVGTAATRGGVFRVPATWAGDRRLSISDKAVAAWRTRFTVLSRLDLDPTSGPTGTRVALTLTGFPALDAVTLRFVDAAGKTIHFATVSTAANGSADGRWTVRSATVLGKGRFEAITGGRIVGTSGAAVDGGPIALLKVRTFTVLAPPDPYPFVDAWEVLHLVLLRTDIPGVGSHEMTAAERRQSVNRATAFESTTERFTNGMIRIDQDIVLVETALTTATPFGPTGSYWVSPADLSSIMAANAASAYDAVVVYASAEGVPCAYGGLTVGGYPGLSHIPIREGYADADGDVTVQPMAVPHEFSHQVEAFMAAHGAIDFPCVDCGHQVGYTGEDDFARFYDDWLSGDVPPPDGVPPYGIGADTWRLGTPNDGTGLAGAASPSEPDHADP